MGAHEGSAKKRSHKGAADQSSGLERAAKMPRKSMGGDEEEDFVRGGHVAISEKERENIKKQDAPRSLFSVRALHLHIAACLCPGISIGETHSPITGAGVYVYVYALHEAYVTRPIAAHARLHPNMRTLAHT